MSIVADQHTVEELREYTAVHGDPVSWAPSEVERYLEIGAAGHGTEVSGARGTGPGGRRLRPNEEVPPLSPEQAERLGELAAVYHRRMVGAARARLVTRGTPDAQAHDLAEDLVQEVWVDVARRARRPGELLGPERLPVDEERRHLLCQVRLAVFHWARRGQRVEEPADLEGPGWQALAASGVGETGQGPLTDRCEQLLAPLDERLRAAMVERCYGVPLARLAELLGVAETTAARLVRRAVARLQGRPATAQEERREVEEASESSAVSALTAEQREALEAMPESVRVALLLRLAGVSWPAIAQRCERSLTTVQAWGRRYGYVLDPAASAGPEEGLPANWEELARVLPARQQQVLRLRAEGCSWPRTAAVAGCSKSGARHAHESAVRRLRRAARDRQAGRVTLTA
ncbi:sigma factor-like helix-turn-helix DNA-binding protein [Streptomyces diacarni]|uniref:sigma factor-like helix-turn-helix DNA-binding protein n=1 Tax=Streptomyces diacarni TaxID=2800381 RepID=UPI0033EA335B